MKHIVQLICICFIIGLVEHVQEVSAHKTLDIENDGDVDATLNTDFSSPDSNTGASGVGDAVLSDEVDESVRLGVDGGFQAPPAGAPGLQDRFFAFFKHEPFWYWRHYRHEIGYLFVFVLAIIKFQIGRAHNDKIATNWRKNIVPIIFNEFPHMGCGEEDKSFAIAQRGYADYEYFASGRKNCKYAEFQLNLLRRHCALTEYGYDLYAGNVDRLVMEIAVDTGSRDIPLEFFVCRRKDLKSKLKSIEYLGDFVKGSNAKHYRLGDKEATSKNALTVMAEHDEIANQIIDAKVGQVLQEYGTSGLLHEIHITDQKHYNELSLFMRIVIEVPDVEDENKINEFNQLFQMSLYMIDLVAGLKMSPTVQSKCAKSRKKQTAIAQKEKEAEQQDKKAEEKRKADQLATERLKRMSPADQAKYERKQKAKDDRRQKSKSMKVMK